MNEPFRSDHPGTLPKSGPLEYLKAIHALLYANKIAEATEQLETAASLYRGSDILLAFSVYQNIVCQQQEAAFNSIETLTASPQVDKEIVVWLADRIWESGRADLAVTILKDLHRRFGSDEPLRIMLNRKLVSMHVMRTQLARVAASDASETTGSDVKSLAHRTLRTSLHKGDFLKTISIGEELLQSDPNDVPVLLYLAVTFYTLGNSPLAQKYCLTALNQSPNDPVATFIGGWMYAFDGRNVERGELQAAKSLFDRSFSLNPSDGFAKELSGWCSLTMGDCQEGLKDLELAREIRERNNLTADQKNGTSVRFLHPLWLLSFGHIWGFEMLAKEQILAGSKKQYILPQTEPIPNRSIVGYYGDLVKIVSEPADLERLLPTIDENYEDTSYVSFPAGCSSIVPRPLSELDERWNKKVGRPLLTLKEEDEARGWKNLATFGMAPGDWFVCIHVRENSQFYTQEGLAIHGHRNADIANYKPLFEMIADKGGWVIRLGDDKMSRVTGRNVIEYSHSSVKSDWMDIFLMAKCKFLIGMISGPSVIPSAFGTPVVYTNVTPFANGIYFPLAKDIVIPKLYWLKQEARLATFGESLSVPLFSQMHRAGFLERVGVTLIENTSDEIYAAVSEMFSGLDGGGYPEEVDRGLHQRLLEIVSERTNLTVPMNFSSYFLRKYSYLLT